MAIAAAAKAYALERAGTAHPGAHWRELAVRSKVGFAVAKRVVRDMVNAGELVVVGSVAVPGARRRMNVVAPSARTASAVDSLVGGSAGADLAAAWRGGMGTGDRVNGDHC